MDQEYTPLDLSTLDLSTPAADLPEGFPFGFRVAGGPPECG